MRYHSSYFWEVPIVCWSLSLLLLVWIVYNVILIRQNQTRMLEPLDILKKRFAEGLISKEEFIEKRNLIDD
jgi:putative membrane protein